MFGTGKIATSTAPSPVFGPDAQHAAQQELRHAEYHRDDPSLVTKIWQWLVHQFDKLFSGTPQGSATLVLLVLFAAVIIFAIVRAGPPKPTARNRAGDEADPLRPIAAADHRKLAAAHAAAGRRAEALREWLRAAVQTIEDRGVLTPRPGRTGAATAREAGPLLPAAAADLRAATTAFDEVWFGGRDAADADVALARAAADAVLHARPAAHATASVGGYALPG
jgi:Domain of unknown function (DUF4129)